MRSTRPLSCDAGTFLKEVENESRDDSLLHAAFHAVIDRNSNLVIDAGRDWFITAKVVLDTAPLCGALSQIESLGRLHERFRSVEEQRDSQVAGLGWKRRTLRSVDGERSRGSVDVSALGGTIAGIFGVLGATLAARYARASARQDKEESRADRRRDRRERDLSELGVALGRYSKALMAASVKAARHGASITFEDSFPLFQAHVGIQNVVQRIDDPDLLEALAELRESTYRMVEGRGTSDFEASVEPPLSRFRRRAGQLIQELD